MSPSDALANPAKALQQLYDANKSQGIENFPGAVTEHFQRIFAPESEFNRIPTLDLKRPPASFANGSLVAFRAMVQDPSLSPELYLATRKNGECGGWGITDDITSGEDVEYGNLRECTVIWAVSIPGLSPWCYDDTSSHIPAPNVVQPHKYPIPDAPHIGVQLKIYDENIARPLRATDLASFVGILTSEPLHAGIEVSEPISVPTLHVLFLVPISASIVSRSFPEPSILPAATTLRNDLVKWIADEALAGDLLAAEWILLSTISRVRSRQPPILPLSLTISSFPAHPENPKLPPALYSVLSLIFPLISTLPLSLDTLNKVSFCPESKDEDLHSGQLQLPKGSILLLNEGAVTEGGILNKGIMNIRAAQEMMKSQTLDYVFPYSGFQFETDVSFVVTTEGKKSTFFQTDITIRLRPQVTENLTEKLYNSTDAINLPPPEKLLNFRRLVAGAKIGNVVVGDAMGKFVEEEFIRERSKTADNKSNGTTSVFTPDDLIQRMLLTRLNALSLHETEVTQDHWESAKELEQALRSREL